MTSLTKSHAAIMSKITITVGIRRCSSTVLRLDAIFAKKMIAKSIKTTKTIPLIIL